MCVVNGQRFYKKQLDFAYIAPSVIQNHPRSTQLILNKLNIQPAVKYATIEEQYDIM